MTKKSQLTLVAVLLAFAIIIAGCGKKEPEKQESSKTETKESAQVAATPIDPNTAATVSGDVKFDGTAPKPQKIDMSQDPACKGTNETETVEVDNGKLGNVFVYVKDGLGDRNFAPPKDAVTIDQNGCRYHPHVLGVMAGQPVTITNSDNTTHNIHPSPKDNREWNESQPPKGAPLSKEFARPEVLIPVKCNQHPWMKMFIGVSKSPFFAVTDKNGKYELKGLPPGTYTIAAVHEKLGEKDQQVTVGAKDSKTVDFTFNGSGGAAGGQ
ncbi:MAG: carboxypeptidase regulatory-like domain-containing protein [Acidobacteriaceae bacterium]|nr:carboxypeptidase regulatory-like domain-containing protein [Acidobacteriaceae bacterium]